MGTVLWFPQIPVPPTCLRITAMLMEEESIPLTITTNFKQGSSTPTEQTLQRMPLHSSPSTHLTNACDFRLLCLKWCYQEYSGQIELLNQCWLQSPHIDPG
jgi:hypothetical protein